MFSIMGQLLLAGIELKGRLRAVKGKEQVTSIKYIVVFDQSDMSCKIIAGNE